MTNSMFEAQEALFVFSFYSFYVFLSVIHRADDQQTVISSW